MRYDSTPPKHCLEDMSCKNNEHILFDNRITRTSEIKLDMAGWFDPYPVHPIQASGIKSFEVNIHDMQEVDSSTLAMDEKSLLTYNVDGKHSTIRLPERQPALYGVSLEVLDGAGNLKKARRFVLYDDSSSLLVDSNKTFFLTSGSPVTNFTWQTHHGDICSTWKDRYYNSYNINYNLLRKINPDFYKFYKGIYEQITGQLPVNGTPNFNGVVGTRYLASCDGTTIQNITLQNFLSQRTCQKYNLKDGQTYEISIIPIDIIRNSLKETITVHIDASVPDIIDISLEKDNVRQLFVHNSSDLSRMNITFEAFDIHSGIHSIEWMLGTTNDNGDLGKGAIAVHHLKTMESCNGSNHCYCPRIGVCEKSLYWVNFNSLVKNNKHKGHHNREYFFALKVTNGAKLVSISKVDILTDDSPPEKGVVEEGPNNSPDIDFTSSKRILVRWSDFIDHESGIKKYRVGISKTCLSKDEMLHNYHSRIETHKYLFETKNNHISVQVENPGQYFTSVIAYNYALEASDVSCSDGIVYDVSEPLVNDLILRNSKSDEFIGCYNSSAWLILNNITAVSLQWTNLCQQKCNESGMEYSLIRHLPRVYLNASDDESYADALCQKLKVYNEEYFTYIPSDEIHLVWNVTDEESQIQMMQIGFLSTKQNSLDPDIMSFTPTKRLLSERMHSGIDPGIPFFIVLKASNKANLETIVTLGPVIIDDTPPQYSGGVNVTMDNDFVYVVWNDKTFLEEEQKEDVSNILFKIGHGSTFFTPLLQGYITHACPKFNNTITCFKYPIRRIQSLNDDYTSFYFELYIYNIVGHSLIIRTENFIVPSRYPPTPGTVLDRSEEFWRSNDIDFIAKGDIVCVDFLGFRHNERVSLELALSTDKKFDNVMKFRPLPQNKCLHNVTLPVNVKIYSLIRASSSGGNTTSMSDGFVVIDKAQVKSALSVIDGVPCGPSSVYFQEKIPATTKNNTISIRKPLALNHIFTLKLTGHRFSMNDISSQDTLWISNKSISDTEIRRSFVPLVNNPTFIVNTNGNITYKNITLDILSCYENADFQTEPQVYKVFWKIQKEYENLVTHFLTTIMSSSRGEAYALPLQKTKTMQNIPLNGIQLKESHAYKAVVQACFENVCSIPEKSKGSIIQLQNPTSGTLSLSLEAVHNHQYNLVMSFERFLCSDYTTAKIYLVSISNKNGEQIDNWRRIHLTNLNSTLISAIIYNITLPIYLKHSVSACVKGVCLSGKSITTCEIIGTKEDGRSEDTNIVYEINADSDDMANIRSFVHSIYLGENMATLHNNEIDIITKNTKLSGVLTNAFGRDIKWYLMTEPRIPNMSCSDDIACLQTTSSLDGVGQFKRILLQENKRYFICAYSSKTILRYEKFTEEKEEIEVCGNGMIVDDSPPIPGEVNIVTDNGYFVNTEGVFVITWENFTDMEQNAEIPFPSGIAKYEYCIGTYVGGRDVIPFVDVGIVMSAVITNVTMNNKVTYFATVRATDRVGHLVQSSSAGVMFDNTPPTIGQVFAGITEIHKYIASHKDISASWFGFDDPESGIKSFHVGIGSSNFTADIYPLTEVDGNFWKLEESLDSIIDGYEYYIHLLVTNNAGLSTTSHSHPFLVDSSPPSGGFVKDGDSQVEVDFQLNTTYICASWDGFHDIHTKLSYYEVGLAISNQEDENFPFTSVGLSKKNCWTGLFEPGMKYYTIVRACNQAGLCTRKYSDGIVVDSSPPVPGLIHVGLSDRHQHYISHRNSISAQWIGFQDPHSDLDHFEFCLSKKNYSCDITSFENVLLTNRITKSGVSLPIGTNLYVILRAYNRVGLYTQRFSEKFRVDTSPPLEVEKAGIDNSQFSYRHGTQYEPSIIIVRWNFSELESHIESNEIILKSHSSGRTVQDQIIYGNENNMTIKLSEEDRLRDGDAYSVLVSCCNAAGLCTQSKSDLVLVDSSPPQIGGFRNPMKWNNVGNATLIQLLWYGFTDFESGVEQYGLAISSSFTGSELSGGIVYINHIDKEIQELSINLTQKISDSDSIILSVFAINKVGLRSKTARATVILFSETVNRTNGFLKIQRYLCRSHTCNFDCTCSVLGQKCRLNGDQNACIKAHNNSVLRSVSFGRFNAQIDVTLSSSCMFSFWTIYSKTYFQRFEWSIGVQHESVGAGVFNKDVESIWKDNGIFKNVTFCLKNGQSFKHDEYYVFYIRVWLSESEYEEIISKPVLVDTTPPGIRRGKSMRESRQSCIQDDIDYLNSTQDFLICWNGVFTESGAKIEKYILSGGSIPYGNDYIDTINLGVSTSHYIDGKTLEPGIRYFFTVTAVNTLGMEISHVSDGIVVDLDIPTAGVLYNTRYHKNREYQSATNELGISWHGFDDMNSYIRNYKIYLSENNGDVAFTEILDAEISNSHIFTGISLKHNHLYRLSVIAYDAVGHSVGPIHSKSIYIDATPPYGFECIQYKKIPFDFSKKSHSVLFEDTHFIYSGVVNITKNDIYKLSFSSFHRIPSSAVHVQIGKDRKELPLLTNANGQVSTEYLFVAHLSGPVNISLSMTMSSVSEGLSFSLHVCNESRLSSYPFRIAQISQTTLRFSMFIRDYESGIKKILLGAGTTDAGYQIRPLLPFPTGVYGTVQIDVPHNSSVYLNAIVENNAGLKSFFKSKPLVIDHTKPNISDLKIDIKYKEYITINGTILEGNISNLSLNDTDEVLINKTFTTMELKWMSTDEESDILSCECAAGNLPFSTTTINWRASETTTSCVLSNLDLKHGTRIYVSVRCTNGVELRNSKTHGPVVISYNRPENLASEVFFLPSNYISIKHKESALPTQSNKSQICFGWKGFEDVSGVLEYETQIKKGQSIIQRWKSVGAKTYTSVYINGADGDVYRAEVRAVNVGGLASEPSNKTIKVDGRAPKLSGYNVIVRKISREEYMIDWSKVFDERIEGSIAFIVSVGKNRGYSDLLKPTYTLNHTISIDTDFASSIYIDIFGVSSTGKYAAYHKMYWINK
ncbi:uncharacterized protein LOC134235054 [Saccostrea cucullata]|uniref:uncharacterized protein LOC134235054 n=1 Tax=Saccostrea cuccullata TaxID=36930 RepID=UPI002ED34E87